jgi:acyl-CoA thioester hydrolase
MSLRFTTQRRVEFRDTDAAGFAHFSAFFVYMEQAEHELLRARGLSVVCRDDQGEISWPRVSASCDYRNPARFEDLLDVQVTIERIGQKSITYRFRFERDGLEIATGRTTAVCCRCRCGEPPQSIRIPAEFVRQLRE